MFLIWPILRHIRAHISNPIRTKMKLAHVICTPAIKGIALHRPKTELSLFAGGFSTVDNKIHVLYV